MLITTQAKVPTKCVDEIDQFIDAGRVKETADKLGACRKFDAKSFFSFQLAQVATEFGLSGREGFVCFCQRVL